MNHLRWMGHCLTIFEIQKNLRDDYRSCEVTLVGKGHSVKAHRFVLSSCSDMLRNALADVPMGQEATIVVPDIRGSLLDSVLAFIYLGETSISSTNLSEFLESINILGIKSAISFECSTPTLPNALNSSSPITSRNMDDIIEDDSMTTQNDQAVMTEQTTARRELEFLDVYAEPQHKIAYSIEHMPHTTNTNEFILTENSGTFTLTPNSKLETCSNSELAKIDEVEDEEEEEEEEEEETDEVHMMDEYSDGGDPIIEIATNSGSGIETGETSTPIIIKSEIKSYDRKTAMNNTSIPESLGAFNPLSTENYTSVNDVKYNTTMTAAVHAVINEGMSLQKASAKFDLSKTVLWRRVRRHPNYMKASRENPLLSLAYERLKNGESLKNISHELDIPMSTLHRHKVRLVQQGRLPDITFKKRDPSSKDQLRIKLNKALYACIHEGMSQNHAANVFDIPKSTLWRHLQKRVADAQSNQRLADDEDDDEDGNIKEEIILS